MTLLSVETAKGFAHSLTYRPAREVLKSPTEGDFLVVPAGRKLKDYFGSMSGRTGIARFQTADGMTGTVNFDCRAIIPHIKK